MQETMISFSRASSSALALLIPSLTIRCVSSFAVAPPAILDNKSPALLFDDILQGNSTAAAVAVDMLADVRGTDAMDQYLSDMMPPEQSSLPLWTRMPFVARVSRRARQLRLRKLLELSIPMSDDKDDKESEKRRARSALFILMRTMANNPDFKGVSSMLSMAKKDARNDNLSSEEMLKRTPDLETPNYDVLVSKKGGFEVRRYEKFSVCSVTMSELKPSGSDKESASKLSNSQLSGATSFGALAGYLFGKNDQQTAMKMTTPVFSEGDGQDRTMSFVLPSDYWEDDAFKKAPKPMSDSAVKISSVDGGDRAVLAFPGLGRKRDVEDRSRRLREMLEMEKDWRAVDGAKVLLAQYNDPFTPPWKRRNEVSLAVEPKQ